MDFAILYAIQNLHCAWLDQIMLVLTKIVGSYGTLWVIVGAVLLIFKKTRKTGFAVLLSYVLVYALGQFVLKDWIARPRPCHIDETVALLVSRPSSYSCPSTHAAWSFGAAMAIFMNHKKAGLAAFALAVIIGFSRLYLFVHFPTDVLLGMAMGILLGILSVKIVRYLENKLQTRRQAQ